MLLKNEANVNVVDRTKSSPLIIAFRRRSASIGALVQLLLQHGADVNPARVYLSPIGEACRRGLMDVANLLLINGADPTVGDCYTNRTPLHFVCSLRNTPGVEDVVRRLVESGVYVNAADGNG